MARQCKKSIPDTPPSSPAPTVETAGTDAAKEYGKLIARSLVEGERAGALREVLGAVGGAFHQGQTEAEDFGSEPAKRLRAGRQATVAYIVSLLGGLDVDTRAQLTEELILNAWMRASPSRVAEAVAAGLKVEVDEGAAFTVLRAMRLAASAFCNLVEENDQRLAGELLHFAVQMVTTLDVVARERPEWVKSGAAERVDWPVLTSLNYPKAADFQEFAARIGLGSKSAVRPQPHHRWKPTTALNRYLLEMLVRECWGDGRPLVEASVPYYLDEVLMPLFDRVCEEVGGWENYPEFARIAREAAKRGKSGTQRSEIRSRVKTALDSMARGPGGTKGS